MIRHVFPILCLFLIIFCSCGRTTESESLGKVPEQSENPSAIADAEIQKIDDVADLEVRDFQIQDGIISYTLYNIGEESVYYGSWYQIECFVEDQWFPLIMLTEIDGVHLTFEDILSEIPPGFNTSFEHELYYFDAQALKPGEYRILRRMHIEHADKTEKFCLSIPFIVE